MISACWSDASPTKVNPETSVLNRGPRQDILTPMVARVTFSELEAKSALNPSRIPGMKYTLNPYRGCAHGCVYCYLRVMPSAAGSRGRKWGSYVDAKTNVARVLLRELRRRKKGKVMLSSATDPYQPIEKKFRLTRTCLELLADARFPVSVLTKSALVARDLDLLQQIETLSVGITITTDSEEVRKIMEPGASPVEERLAALQALEAAGLEPHVFIGPVLPMDAKALARRLEPLASLVYFDSMNYPSLCRKLLMQKGLGHALDPWYVDSVIAEFEQVMGRERIERVGG